MARTNPREIEPMSVVACRRLLGAAASGLSDAELIAMRDQFYAIAGCALVAFQRAEREDATVLDPVDADVREEIEERAAIFQFDGNLPKAVATRAAVSAYVADAVKDE